MCSLRPQEVRAGETPTPALPSSPLAVVGQVLSKHAHGLELGGRGGLDLVQDHTVFPLQSRQAHRQLVLLSRGAQPSAPRNTRELS